MIMMIPEAMREKTASQIASVFCQRLLSLERQGSSWVSVVRADLLLPSYCPPKSLPSSFMQRLGLLCIEDGDEGGTDSQGDESSSSSAGPDLNASPKRESGERRRGSEENMSATESRRRQAAMCERNERPL